MTVKEAGELQAIAAEMEAAADREWAAARVRTWANAIDKLIKPSLCTCKEEHRYVLCSDCGQLIPTTNCD